MKKTVRFPFLLLAVVFLQAPNYGLIRDQTGPPDAEKLAALLRADSFREADRLASVILAGKTVDSRTMAVCGLAVLKAGRVEESETIFRKALSLAPDNPEAHLGLGRLAFIRNDVEAAISHFRRAVPSAGFYEEALRRLWRAAWDRGLVSEINEVRALAEKRLELESRPLPSFIANGSRQIEGLEGKRIFRMEGNFERLRVPLVSDPDPRIFIRRIALKLNGKGEYLFDIDSASADFLTISPLLAEELELVQTGNASATGVGTLAAPVRFTVLDKVEVGGVAFFDVPVMVSDLQTFREAKKGLLGSAFLKRFNVTIDTEKNIMDLYPLNRPDLLAAGIDRSAVAADVRLFLYDQTVVAASLEGAPEALYILDSAAGTNLVDSSFFAEHIRPKLDPARLHSNWIQGAQGAQEVVRIDGLRIGLGSLVFPSQTVHEFSMKALNEIAGRYTAGLLGNPLLWPYRVHMDFHSGRLILEKR